MTGQYPKRRETDAEAAQRNAWHEAARRVLLELAVPITEAKFKALLPRISQSGRLIGGR